MELYVEHAEYLTGRGDLENAETFYDKARTLSQELRINPNTAHRIVATLIERGLLVVRSLTKHWSIPGIRAGYLLGNDRSIAGLAAKQVPWSVSTPTVHAVLACTTPEAAAESAARAARIARWRHALVGGLADRGTEVLASRTSFVLARLGPGTREALREEGVAVRRADTFPGLDGDWVRIAVRPPETAAVLFEALDRIGAG